MEGINTDLVSIEGVRQAEEKLKGLVTITPLMESMNVSSEHNARIFLKREDLQVVRSYKIRGAFNKISSLSETEVKNGVVCASAGNYAQGVAFSCNNLSIKGTIFMPATTSGQKIERVKMFGNGWVDIKLIGDSYDDSHEAAEQFCQETNSIFVHPFDDVKVIEGQATVGLEILEQSDVDIDYLFIPIGGGGLAAGVSAVFKALSPKTKIIGVEPIGAPSMSVSLKNGVNTELEEVNPFVDGASVKKVGDICFNICKTTLDDMITVDEGKICETILKLYNKDAIVAEPAGALSIAALNQYHDKIAGKNVVCILSGGNNDITRTEEIKERALLYGGLKHYFIIRFPQRPKALKEFVVNVLGESDDITHFEYTKKHNRAKGPAVVGIQLKNSKDLEPLMQRMKQFNFAFEHLNLKPDLMNLLT